MTVERRFVLYLVLIHLVFAVSAAAFLAGNRPWLLLVEGFFLVSFVAGVRLVRGLVEPVSLLRSGVDSLRSSDFTTRFKTVGQPELDELIEVYNRMVDHLREARVRGEEQQLFLERILAASPAAIVIFDLDGKVSDVNPAAAELLGVEAGALAGLGLVALEPALGGAVTELAVGEAQVLSLYGRRRVRAERLTFIDRGFRREFLLLVELTEELRRSEKAAYEKLIRMMSHEVNNTTGAIGSLLESCLNYRRQIRSEDRDDFVRALEVAIDRGQRMNQFMRQFADVIRLPVPKPRPSSVRAVVDDLFRLLAREMEEREIRLELSDDGTLGPIAIDRAQFEQALLNIVRNALESIGRSGSIHVELGDRGRRPSLAVRDTGGGISADAQAQLFTPFFTTKDDGQGVGLTLVQEILLGHGFEFSLRNVDGGAEFTILF